MEFVIANLTICILSFILNALACGIIVRKRPLKPFQILLLNIVSLNVLYALNEMSTRVLNIISPDIAVLETEQFIFFITLKASLIAHSICLFIVFMAFQRLIAVKFPLKYAQYVTKRNTFRGSLLIYFVVFTVFIICSVLIWKINLGAVIQKTLNWIFIVESFLVVTCYVLIIYKIKTSTISSAASSEDYIVKIAIIISVSFLVSYNPIGLVLVLQIQSETAFRVVLLMVWIDSFVNPIIVILDTFSMLKSSTDSSKIDELSTVKCHMTLKKSDLNNATEELNLASGDESQGNTR